jgi:hypothetical protein
VRQEGKKDHDFDYCIDECPNKCTPEPVLRVMVDELRENHHRGTHISITALQHCIRQVFLERTMDYAIEPKFGIWQSLRGTLIHAMFEHSGDPDRFLCEVDYKHDFKGVTVNGRLDLYDMQEETLIDFKTQNDWGYQYTLKAEAAKPEHVWQTNFYRFLLEKGENVPREGAEKLGNFPVKKIKIIYLSMKSVVETGSVVHEFDSRSGKVKVYNMEDVPLYTHAQIRSYVNPRAKILNQAFEKRSQYEIGDWLDLTRKEQEAIMPPPVSDENDRGWLCGERYKQLRGYCAVRELCPYWQDMADEDEVGYGENAL